MSYKLMITEPAESDLGGILNYISNDLSAPKSAVDFLNAVEKCYDRISDNPFIYPECEIPRFKKKNYRKAVIKNYVLIYRTDEKTKAIYILRVFYGGRNYEKLL